MKPTSLALALGLLASPAAAADELTLLLDWYINPNHGPIIIAEERGYFAEAGLEVEVIAPADPSAPPKLVAAGQGDIAVSYQVQQHLQVAQGLPLVRVGTLIATPLNCLMALADGPIKTPGDLRGKTVGFSVAGVEEALLGAILGKYDITLDEVTLVNVNFSISPALMSEQVDAVIGAYRNFELNQMAIEGIEGHCMYIEEEGVPPHDELIYVANPDTMDPDKVIRFLGAVEKATQYIVNHPDAAWEIFKGTAAELDDELNARAWVDTLPRFALRPAALDAGRYARFEEFLVGAGLLEGARPVDKIAIDVTAQ
jgi:putative hydroxymethylpyrimidine transport system substrate-binding protein